MAVLHRKLLRDLLGNIGTLASIIVITAIGSGTFIGFGAAQRILVASQQSYYRQYQFADFWIDVKKAPRSAVERLATMPEIAALDDRVVFDVILDLPARERPVTGRLISSDPRHPANALNGLCLVRGSGFSGERDEEVIVGEAFARAHDLHPGDRIGMILNRKRQSFVIVGTAISPEYVYMVRGPGDLIPDAENFGILYLESRYAREVLGFQDACNQIIGRVAPEHLGEIDALLARIERTLEPFGVLETTPRDRQASHRFLSDEIAGLGVTAKVMPAIFLGVAALVLNILMTRLAQRQRTEIGTLKALGYSDASVMGHFLSFGVVVGLLGGLAGVALGSGLTAAMVVAYKSFFQFPSFHARTDPDLLLLGVAIAVAFAVVGAARGARAVLELRPAEAMRPKPPAVGGAIFLERFPSIWRRLGFRTHLALRATIRNRTRSLTAVVATALATAITFMALAMYDSFGYMVDYQFSRIARSDIDLGLRSESSLRALHEARNLPGADYAEPLFGIRCDLRNGPRARRMSITGLAPGHRLTTPLDADERPIAIPPEGLVLSRKLAELLAVEVGDTLELTPVRGRRDTRRVPVASVVRSFLGMDCYADMRYLSRIVGESLAVNAVQLKVDPSRHAELFARIKQLPDAQGLSVRAELRRNIEETIVQTSVFSIGLMVFFAGMISFGSTLNNALIEIGDRIREIATLRVLGYHPGQVAGILFRQTLITWTLGVLLAFPLGYAMIQLIAGEYDSELYRLPVVIRPSVIGWTVALAVLFMLAAQAIVYRQILRLDWQAGIKVKE